MTNVPEELNYTRAHEWLRVSEDGLVTVGITDHGQESVGRIDSVGLPSVPLPVLTGDPIAVLASATARADLRGLFDGEIIEINDAILDSPGWVNDDPYTDGWLYRIRPTEPFDPAVFLDAAAYTELITG
ncbi:glycine cleavage system protein H [Actinocorallia lasiicapitis]